MRKWVRVLAVAMAAVLALMAAGCSTDESPAGGAVDKDNV